MSVRRSASSGTSRFSPPEKIAYVIDRFERETDRVLRVLDGRLATSRYLVGDHYGAADVMTWPWIDAARSKLGVRLESHPKLARWRDEVGSRPAVQRGLLVPDLAEHEAAT